MKCTGSYQVWEIFDKRQVFFLFNVLGVKPFWELVIKLKNIGFNVRTYVWANLFISLLDPCIHHSNYLCDPNQEKKYPE